MSNNAKVTLHSDLSSLLVYVVQLERWINKSALSATQEHELRQIVNQMLSGALNDSTLNVFTEIKEVKTMIEPSVDTRKMADDFDEYMDSLLSSATVDVVDEKETDVLRNDAWKDDVVDTSSMTFDDLTDMDENSDVDFLMGDDVVSVELPDEPYTYDPFEDEFEAEVVDNKDVMKELIENQSYQEVNEESQTPDDDFQVGEHEDSIEQKRQAYDDTLSDIEANTLVEDMFDMDTGLNTSHLLGEDDLEEEEPAISVSDSDDDFVAFADDLDDDEEEEFDESNFY